MELIKSAIPDEISERITVLRYPLAVLVVMLHASWGTTNADFIKFDLAHNPFTFVQWFVQAIGCGAVPLFFAISSYLIFKKAEPYTVLIRKKIRSLVIPYFVWTCLTILFYWIAAKFSFMQRYFESKPDLYVSGWNVLDWFKAFMGWGRENGHPIGGPLWFVRDLIFFVLLVPVIQFFMKRFACAFLLLVSIMYFYGIDFYFIGTSSLFYCVLGAYYAQVDVKFEKLISLSTIEIFVLLAISYFIMKFAGRGDEIYTCIVSLSLWTTSRYLILSERITLLLKKVSVYSFFLFAIHGMMMLVAKTLLCKLFTLHDYNFLCVWLLSIILVTVIGTAVSILICHFIPKVYFVLNGGR